MLGQQQHNMCLMAVQHVFAINKFNMRACSRYIDTYVCA
jgi:hypothetical protein